MSGAKNNYGVGVGAAAGVLLAIYVFLPVPLINALFTAAEREWIPEKMTVHLFSSFHPVFLAAEACPPYAKLLEGEMRFGQRMGWSGPWDASLNGHD